MNADRDPNRRGESGLKCAIKAYLADDEELRNCAVAVAGFRKAYVVALTNRRLLLLRKQPSWGDIVVDGIQVEYVLPSLPPVDVSVGPFVLALTIRDPERPSQLRFSVVGVFGIPDLDNRRQAFAIAAACGVSEQRLSQPQNYALGLIAEVLSTAVSRMRPVEHKPLRVFWGVLIFFVVTFGLRANAPAVVVAGTFFLLGCASTVLFYSKRWAVLALSGFWALSFLIGLIANAPSLPVFFQLGLLAVFWALVFPIWESFD